MPLQRGRIAALRCRNKQLPDLRGLRQEFISQSCYWPGQWKDCSTRPLRPVAPVPSHSCAIWMERVACRVSEGRLVDVGFLLLPSRRDMHAITSHISLARPHHMAHLTAKVAGKCSLPYAQEKEESQILVSTRDACQCNLESGLQDEGADLVRQTAGSMCRDSWKS